MRHVEYAKERKMCRYLIDASNLLFFLRQSSIKKAADVPSKTKTQANSFVRLGYDVCVRQNLVLGAIFESVSNDK